MPADFHHCKVLLSAFFYMIPWHKRMIGPRHPQAANWIMPANVDVNKYIFIFDPCSFIVLVAKWGSFAVRMGRRMLREIWCWLFHSQTWSLPCLVSCLFLHLFFTVRWRDDLRDISLYGSCRWLFLQICVSASMDFFPQNWRFLLPLGHW